MINDHMTKYIFKKLNLIYKKEITIFHALNNEEIQFLNKMYNILPITGEKKNFNKSIQL